VGSLTHILPQLYRSIALARCLFRFIGVTDAVEALKNDSWAGNWPDVPQIRLLARLEAWTMVWYHAFEHLAWAASVAPKFVRFDASKWFAVSDWGWLAYCLIDAWMNRLKLAALRKREEKMRRMRLRSGADVGADEEELRLARRMVLLQQLRMLFYIPNAWHWAYTKGKIPGAAVAVLGLSEAVVGLIQSFPRK
jgi:hypothetical protein